MLGLRAQGLHLLKRYGRGAALAIHGVGLADGQQPPLGKTVDMDAGDAEHLRGLLNS